MQGLLRADHVDQREEENLQHSQCHLSEARARLGQQT